MSVEQAQYHVEQPLYTESNHERVHRKITANIAAYKADILNMVVDGVTSMAIWSAGGIHGHNVAIVDVMAEGDRYGLRIIVTPPNIEGEPHNVAMAWLTAVASPAEGQYNIITPMSPSGVALEPIDDTEKLLVMSHCFDILSDDDLPEWKIHWC